MAFNSPLENSQTALRETDCIRIIASYYPGSRWEQLPQFHTADFLLVDELRGKRCYIEVKSRNYHSKAWSSYMIHQKKWQNLLKLEKETGIPVYLAYIWNDNVVTFMKVEEGIFETSFKSRTDREYSADSAMKLMIPANRFYRFENHNQQKAVAS